MSKILIKIYSRMYFFLFLLMMPGYVLSHGMSEADRQSIIDAGLQEYVILGAGHMLSGYDHLLFLFGVLFFLSRFGDIVRFITAFTLGHSITLIVATLYHIQINYYLIDAIIALTVCYKAFENLDGFRKYLNYQAPNLLWMVFGFGLIHGLGLSTRLQQLPLPQDGLVQNIIAFNVGVEFGQVVALTVMLVLLAGWRKRESFTHFSRISNVLLMVFGFMLLMMQLHGYQHSVYGEEFPVNRDDHYHLHEDMKVNERPSALDGYQRRIFLQKLPEGDADHQHDDGSIHAH